MKVNRAARLRLPFSGTPGLAQTITNCRARDKNKSRYTQSKTETSTFMGRKERGKMRDTEGERWMENKKNWADRKHFYKTQVMSKN